MVHHTLGKPKQVERLRSLGGIRRCCCGRSCCSWYIGTGGDGGGVGRCCIICFWCGNIWGSIAILRNPIAIVHQLLALAAVGDDPGDGEERGAGVRRGDEEEGEEGALHAN